MARGGGLLRVPRSVEALSRVLTCGLTPLQRARLLDASRGSATVDDAKSPHDLIAMLRAAVDPLDLVALGPQTRDSRMETVVRAIRRERPQLPILVYFSASNHESSTIPALTQAGAHEIVIPGYNDEGVRLLAAVTAARRGCAERWVLARLTTVLPPRLMRFAEAIIGEPAEVTSVPSLAGRVGVHRKTLYNWCELTRFFPPGELILWCRLALVAYYVETTACSVDTISRELGFPSPAALRNTLKRYTGRTATQLREGGGLDYFISIFAEALADFRAARDRS
jgi:AraC-like DNA-binding protein